MGLLDGRGVVITGSGRGLGRSFALAAARDGAGVVVNDIDVEEAEKVVEEIRAEGGRAIASGESVADWDAAGRLIESCVAEFGSIDGLVNNAVSYNYFGPPWDEEGDQIRRQVEVNVLGTSYCGVHAMRRMKAQRSGAIVNLTSRSMIGVSGLGTYSMTKGAIASATFCWSLDLRPHNVRVNALAPGALTRAYEIAGTYSAHASDQAMSPDLVAPAVVYLLSDLSAGLTGQILALLGGRLGMMGHPKMLDLEHQRDDWTAQDIAEVVEREYYEHLQPVGVLAEGRYEWPEDYERAAQSNDVA